MGQFLSFLVFLTVSFCLYWFPMFYTYCDAEKAVNLWVVVSFTSWCRVSKACSSKQSFKPQFTGGEESSLRYLLSPSSWVHGTHWQDTNEDQAHPQGTSVQGVRYALGIWIKVIMETDFDQTHLIGTEETGLWHNTGPSSGSTWANRQDSDENQKNP